MHLVWRIETDQGQEILEIQTGILVKDLHLEDIGEMVQLIGLL